jgi:hypothetical protein
VPSCEETLPSCYSLTKLGKEDMFPSTKSILPIFYEMSLL